MQFIHKMQIVLARDCIALNNTPSGELLFVFITFQ